MWMRITILLIHLHYVDVYGCPMKDVKKEGVFVIWNSYIYRGSTVEMTRFKRPKQDGDKDRKMHDIRGHLTEACSTLENRYMNTVPKLKKTFPNSDLPERLLVSDKFKIIGCKITKVGSTNMARLLYTLDNLSKTNNSNKVSKGKARKQTYRLERETKNLPRLREKLKTYTTFMFVRDPMERLLSAYRDKRPPAWFEEQINFSKYLERVIETPFEQINKHLKLYYTQCKPCTVMYDFIGHLKNYEEDMTTILKSVGADKSVILPERSQTGYTEEKSSDVVHHYKMNVPRNILKQIYEKYYVDYHLFGFVKPF